MTFKEKLQAAKTRVEAKQAAEAAKEEAKRQARNDEKVVQARSALEAQLRRLDLSDITLGEAEVTHRTVLFEATLPDNGGDLLAGWSEGGANPPSLFLKRGTIPHGLNTGVYSWLLEHLG